MLPGLWYKFPLVTWQITPFASKYISYFQLVISKIYTPTIESMFPLCLWLPDRKVLDQNGPYISMSQTKIRNVYLSSAVGHLQLMQRLEIFTKKYLTLSKIILTLLDFLHLRLFVWAGQKHCPISEKNITKINGICVW